MNQQNEAVVLESEEEIQAEQNEEPSSEPQGLMEQGRANVSHGTEEESEEPLSHLESQDVDEEEEFERPEWFPQKFWDDDGPNLEKMAESYVNMEKQFHKGKHKAPEDGKYNFDFIQDTIGNDDPVLNSFSEWAAQNGVSQSAFEEMTSKVLEMSNANIENTKVDVAREKKKLGENADAIINANAQWVEGQYKSGFFSKQEVEEMDILGYTAAGQTLLQKIRTGFGENVQIPTHTLYDGGGESENDFKMRMSEKMNDPRYKSDPSFQKSVEKEFALFYQQK